MEENTLWPVVEKIFIIPRTIRLLGAYILVLFIGSIVFVKLEQPAEQNRCSLAQEQLGEKVAAFGDSYFYKLSLNKKMCKGIRKMKEQGGLGSQFAKSSSLFYSWESENCSKESYELIVNQLMSNPELEENFFQLYDRIVAISQFERFNEETLEISGATFRALMEESASVAIDNYVTAKNHCQNQWNLHSSFFFAGTVATTIGYGHMVPQTAEGRSFLMIFMLFGIPFFAMLTQSISSEINIHVLQRKKGIISPSCDYIFGGIVFIILVPVYIFSRIEEWTLFEALYFSLVTLSTIGFGDIVPREDPPSSYAIYKKNETRCLNHLVNPMPAQHSYLNNPCDETVFAENAELYFDIYRVCIFFWIICGLVWLGGIIKLICNKLAEDVSPRSTKTEFTVANNSIRNKICTEI